RVHRSPVDGRPPNDMRQIRGGRLEASDGFFCSLSSSFDLSSLSALVQVC
ncbi:unnamed protein product, partial [Musa banksii]